MITDLIDLIDAHFYRNLGIHVICLACLLMTLKLRLHNYISPDYIFHTIIGDVSWELDLLYIGIYLVLLFSSNGSTLFIDCNHEIHLHCPYLEGKIVWRRTNSTNFFAGKHHVPNHPIHCNDTVVVLCSQQLSRSP